MNNNFPSDTPLPTDSDDQLIEELRESLGGRFEIKKKLGSGSMATVYLALERELGRLVAIKVLSPAHAEDETAKKRFEREAKAAASLSHPKVVQVYQLGRLPDGTPYLVMRFVRGRTMEERLRGEGRMPLDLARQILIDVASALSAAHTKGIVHRDVRPANVLWDEDNEEALLADFGIAALLMPSGDDNVKLTQTGQMVGKPRYMSPEQLRDSDLTEMADIYGLGILGYELFTGEGPYDAKTTTEWMTAHLTAEPRDLAQLRPAMDPQIASLLRRCLNREPNHRPTASDVVRSLAEDDQSSSGVGGGHGQEPAGLDQVIKRRVPQIVAAAAALGVGLMGIVGQFVELGRLPDWTFDLTLPFVPAAIAGATVIAWFHGERGDQKSPVLEWILLSVIGVVWLAVSAGILLRG